MALKKNSFIFLKKVFLIFWEMELSYIFPFSQKRAFLIFQALKASYISRGTIPSSKNKNFLYIKNWKFLAPNLNNSYFFSKFFFLIFHEETCEARKRRIFYVSLKEVLSVFRDEEVSMKP